MRLLPWKSFSVLPIVGLFLALLQAVNAGPTTQRAKAAFFLKGKPIHPMSVAPLVGDLANEQPVIAAVDLEGSAAKSSNRAAPEVHKGTIMARDDQSGFVAYRHLGATANGLYVI